MRVSVLRRRLSSYKAAAAVVAVAVAAAEETDSLSLFFATWFFLSNSLSHSLSFSHRIQQPILFELGEMEKTKNRERKIDRKAKENIEEKKVWSSESNQN